MHILWYEQFTQDPEPFKELAEFLGCDSAYIAHDFEPLNDAPRPEAVSVEVIERLRSYYEPHVLRLEELLGRSMKCWR